jgi:hypothetical protein
MATSQIKKFQKGGVGGISPWDLVVTRNKDGGFKVTVIPGLLNNFLAKNWDIEKILTGDELHYAKAVVKTNGKNITDVNIQIDTSPPPIQEALPWSIQENIVILFGLFRSGSPFRTIPIGQIVVWPRVWIRAIKPEAAQAGEMPYDEYFYLT